MPEPDAEPSTHALPQNPTRLADAADNADTPSAVPAAAPSGAVPADSAIQFEQLFQLAQAVLAEEPA